MQDYANLVACQDRLVKKGEWVRYRLRWFCGKLVAAPVRAMLSVAEWVDYQLLWNFQLKYSYGYSVSLFKTELNGKSFQTKKNYLIVIRCIWICKISGKNLQPNKKSLQTHKSSQVTPLVLVLFAAPSYCNLLIISSCFPCNDISGWSLSRFFFFFVENDKNRNILCSLASWVLCLSVFVYREVLLFLVAFCYLLTDSSWPCRLNIPSQNALPAWT